MITGPTSHRYISQRLRLHYVDWGNPTALPLLLVHGSRDHCRSWDWVARELAQDWHVIAPDLRVMAIVTGHRMALIRCRLLSMIWLS